MNDHRQPVELRINCVLLKVLMTHPHPGDLGHDVLKLGQLLPLHPMDAIHGARLDRLLDLVLTVQPLREPSRTNGYYIVTLLDSNTSI
eukprot:9492775-Pyramimonas_sp.AAC.1